MNTGLVRHRPGSPGPSLLWVNHFAVAPDMGGPTRHIEMSRELVRRGWNVTIAASDFHLHRRTYMRRTGASDRAVYREPLDGAEFAWLWASPYASNDHRRIRNWLTFSRSLLSMPQPMAPSVVIGSSPHLFAALAAYRVARRHRAPFVLEVRDLWPESLQVAGRRAGPGYLGLWSLARFLYRVAERIIVLAEGSGAYLADHGVPREKLVFLPNGVDVVRFVTEEPPPRASLRLVYTGAHGPANGLDAVLDAAERLRHRREVEFVLVGDGPSKAALQRSADARALDNVTFLDPVPKTEIPALLASADAGLMVLRDTPVFAFGVSPNKLFDYWAAGLPVICNVPGEVAASLRIANGGIQAADASGAALAEAIERMLRQSPSERRQLGRNGRAWVIAHRDRAVLARTLDVLLRDLSGMAPMQEPSGDDLPAAMERTA